MKKVVGLLSCVIVGFILSCQKSPEPNYSIIPYIEFRDFEFIPGNVSSLIPDTLKLKFYLRDGDFDLGLGPNDINPPYNLFYFLDKASGELIPGNEIPADYSNLVIYKDRKTIDTLPALNCSRWMLKYSSDLPPKVIDTLYFQANPNARNLFLGIYTEDNTQVWTYFDINAQNSFRCNFSSNVRFKLAIRSIPLPSNFIKRRDTYLCYLKHSS